MNIVKLKMCVLNFYFLNMDYISFTIQNVCIKIKASIHNIFNE